MRGARLAIAVAALAAGLVVAAPAGAVGVHVQRIGGVRQHAHLSFAGLSLPDGGYYYAIVVLRRYGHYSASRPPPCSTASNMQRADYGYPGANGTVSLTLAPSRSATHHWCPGGHYEGAVYAVPHAPPCEGRYPCRSEPYEPPSPCWHSGEHVVCGVVALPREWAFPDPLPAPLASGTKVVGRFTLRFPSATRR
jgi:hypothetical protein